MGFLNLLVDPKAHNPEAIQKVINDLHSLHGSAYFLNYPKYLTVYVTDNAESLSKANQDLIKSLGVRITSTGFIVENPEKGGLAGLSQTKDNEPKFILLDPSEQTKKPILNTLIHEIGHFKWKGIGNGRLHNKVFYKMLSDALKKLGLPPKGFDTNYQNIEDVINPLGDDVFGNINLIDHGELPLRDSFGNLVQHASLQDDGPPEGLRHNAVPIVVSIGPNVVNTPMGSSEVPVAYYQIGFFDDSIKTTRSVYFTSNQSFTMASRVAVTTGDEAGSPNGGITSGTRNGEAEPIEASTSVKSEGNYVIRDGDAFWLNNRNCTGRAIFQIIGTPKDKKIT